MEAEGDDKNNWVSILEDTNFVLGLETTKLRSCRRNCTIFSEEIETCVRESEGKLVKLYARVLYFKWLNHVFSGNCDEPNSIKDFGSMESWLIVVNLSDSAIHAILQQTRRLFDFVVDDGSMLQRLCNECCSSGDDRSRLLKSAKNLKNYFNQWKDTGQDPKDSTADVDLSWGSYDRIILPSRRIDRRSESEKASACDSGVGSNPSLPSLPTQTPPPSPGYAFDAAIDTAVVNHATSSANHTHLQPHSCGSNFNYHFGAQSQAAQSGFQTNRKTGSGEPKTPSTPPPKWKWNIGGKEASTSGITRSHSHESQLPHRINQHQGVLGGSAESNHGKLTTDLNQKVRLSPLKPTTLPLGSIGSGGSNSIDGLLSPGGSDLVSEGSPVLSPPHNAVISPTSGEIRSYSQPPKSPKMESWNNKNVRMMHNINHKLVRTHHCRLNETCRRCSHAIGLFQVVLKCKACKQKFHEECGLEEGPICGLPEEYVKILMSKHISGPGSPSFTRLTSSASCGLQSIAGNFHADALDPELNAAQRLMRHHESSSSAESSTPSTPALRGPALVSPALSYLYNQKGKATFTFPDVATVPEVPNITIENTDLPSSNDSEVTESLSSDDRTIGPHSIGSEDTTDVEFVTFEAGAGSDLSDSIGSGNSGFSRRRGEWAGASMKTSSWSEWFIDYDKIKLDQAESLIGRGCFGEVHRGYWYQPIALKILDMDYLESEKQLESFKQDVINTFRNTRHQNIILFLGCILTPRLGIVMDLCKGHTIYQILHLRKERDRFDMSRIVNIAAGIAQGMSYLHGKKIIHKDLRSKNVFLENNRVVITDFALMSIQRLCKTRQKRKFLNVPENWLCYLAPELIRSIPSDLYQLNMPELPFSTSSDVFAFGTVWYELISGEFPFKKTSADAIIWQVGRGMKAPLSNVQVAKEVKDILLECWAFDAGKRPDFNQLTKKFEQLPKKRLARSPSHPVNMSRSAESVF